MGNNEILFSTHSLAVVLLTAAITVGCVLLHYEGFTLLQRWLVRVHIHLRRRRILLLIFGLMALHIADVWLFGVGYYALIQPQCASELVGSHGGGLELIYFSAVVYTTLGLGDLAPVGAIRFMVGSEALTGFLLITWSASFTFIEMQKFWKT